MAALLALLETPFTLLLRVDSDQPLPDNDADVITSLRTDCALFKKVKKVAASRLELLACLMCVHAHQIDLHVV